MSGHSKWSKVKHQKAVTDAIKAQIFTKLGRAITIAVAEGGGVSDPEGNFRLRLAIEKARAANMPKENINRAIERGRGGGEGVLEQVIYEGYGPAGVGFIIEATTDNRQRTVSQIKNLLERNGGNLAGPGSVSFNFKKNGVVLIPKQKPFNEVLGFALEVGADDCVERDDVFEFYTSVMNLDKLKKAVEDKGIHVDNAEIIYRPVTTVSPSEAENNRIESLVKQLEELPDVQLVFTNLI